MVQYNLDSGFSALATTTRRGILELVGQEPASVGDLATRFDMTLTGMKKHIQILERAGLLQSEKVGRVRTCRLGPRRLDAEAAWLNSYRSMLEARLDSLADFLERTKGHH